MIDTIEGTVKWFNVEKGYGFIAVASQKDVFVHISALERSGLTGAQFAAAQGKQVVFTTEPGRDGCLQVCKVTELAGERTGRRPRMIRRKRHAAAAPRQRTYLKAGDRAVGQIKWFDHQKGYGFLALTSQPDHSDVFLHITAVEEELISYLVEGAVFDIVIGETERGLVANPLGLHETQSVAAE